MSYCTLLIIKALETRQIKEDISQHHSGFARNFPFVISTNYYSQKDFKNIPQIQNTFSQYDLILIEDYLSSFANPTEEQWKYEELDKKIEKFKKRKWSENKIQEYREKEIRKIQTLSLHSTNSRNDLEKVLFKLANKYFIAFVYYWQGKDENGNMWEGFTDMTKIEKRQDRYEENIIYHVNN